MLDRQPCCTCFRDTTLHTCAHACMLPRVRVRRLAFAPLRKAPTNEHCPPQRPNYKQRILPLPCSPAHPTVHPARHSQQRDTTPVRKTTRTELRIRNTKEVRSEHCPRKMEIGLASLLVHYGSHQRSRFSWQESSGVANSPTSRRLPCRVLISPRRPIE